MTWEEFKEKIRTRSISPTRFRIDGSDTGVMMYNKSCTVIFSRDNKVVVQKDTCIKLLDNCPFDVMNKLIDIFYAFEDEEEVENGRY